MFHLGHFHRTVIERNILTAQIGSRLSGSIVIVNMVRFQIPRWHGIRVRLNSVGRSTIVNSTYVRNSTILKYFFLLVSKVHPTYIIVTYLSTMFI
jgi:hypothetical protein